MLYSNMHITRLLLLYAKNYTVQTTPPPVYPATVGFVDCWYYIVWPREYKGCKHVRFTYTDDTIQPSRGNPKLKGTKKIASRWLTRIFIKTKSKHRLIQWNKNIKCQKLNTCKQWQIFKKFLGGKSWKIINVSKILFWFLLKTSVESILIYIVLRVILFQSIFDL